MKKIVAHPYRLEKQEFISLCVVSLFVTRSLITHLSMATEPTPSETEQATAVEFSQAAMALRASPQRLLPQGEVSAVFETHWATLVTHIQRIAAENGDPLSVQNLAALQIGSYAVQLDGGQYIDVPYRNSRDYVLKVVTYAEELQRAQKQGKQAEIRAALTLYPGGTHACLQGELSELEKAIIQLKHPLLKMIFSAIDEVASTVRENTYSGNEKHLTGALMLTLGIDVRLVQTMDASAVYAYNTLPEHIIIEAEFRILQLLRERLSSAYEEMQVLLTRHTLTEGQRIRLDLNPLAQTYLHASAKDDTMPPLLNDFPEQRTLRQEDLAELHRENPDTPPDVMAKKIEAQQYFHPNANALTLFTQFLEGHLGGGEPASI